MKRLAEEHPGLKGLQAVYADLDGTLLGPGGSLFAASEGGITERAAETVGALHEHGIALVLMSGRTQRGIREVARVLGARAYIAELGAILVERDGPEELTIENFGAYEGEGRPVEAIARTGAGAFLLERFSGYLRVITPWTEATMMFEGYVDPDEANAALREGGYGWLRFHDNGTLRHQVPGLDVPEAHFMHLLPRDVTKASAVRLHRERHHIPAAATIAIGDSPSDLAAASEVGAFFLVANGAGFVEALPEVPPNAYLTSAPHGDGFAEAVRAVLTG